MNNVILIHSLDFHHISERESSTRSCRKSWISFRAINEVLPYTHTHHHPPSHHSHHHHRSCSLCCVLAITQNNFQCKIFKPHTTLHLLLIHITLAYSNFHKTNALHTHRTSRKAAGIDTCAYMWTKRWKFFLLLTHFSACTHTHTRMTIYSRRI